MQTKVEQLYKTLTECQIGLESITNEVRLYNAKLALYDSLIQSNAVSLEAFPEGEIEALQFLSSLGLQRFEVLNKKIDQLEIEIALNTQ